MTQNKIKSKREMVSIKSDDIGEFGKEVTHLTNFGWEGVPNTYYTYTIDDKRCYAVVMRRDYYEIE